MTSEEVAEVREQVAREIEADPFWTGARAARDYAAAIARGTCRLRGHRWIGHEPCARCGKPLYLRDGSMPDA